MCGIAGVVGPEADRNTILAMLDAMVHRGPDFTGDSTIPQQFALGHNRLAIIDLSSSANQPMEDESGRYELVFNGEIYNYLELRNELKDHYRFRTHSDTEVLLAAFSVWGKDMLHRLNGMFAFAIYNRETGELFAARDRFGVKPFYYLQKDHTLYFASEIGAFKAAGLELVPDEKIWSEYLCFGRYGGPRQSFWKGVLQLEAGHFLMFRDQLEIKPWYSFVERVKAIKHGENPEEIQKSYEHLLTESVMLRFRADVDVGFNLSGGLDSSTLLAMVMHTQADHSKIKAYTFYSNDKRYDEIYWVNRMLENRRIQLQEVLLEPHDVPRLARELADITAEPFGGIPTLAYAQIFKRARQQRTLVLLDGQGMDEQWAGYDYYTSGTGNLVQGVRGKLTRSQLLPKDFRALAVKNTFPAPFNDPVQNLQYRDLFYTKIPRALRFNDRVSMASSVELREPFLDYRLVEFAFSLPLKYKIRDSQRKWMLRRIAERHLNKEIALAPKRELQTPQREWLGKELAPYVEQQLDSIESSATRHWFNMKELRQEWQKYLSGNQDNSFYVWQWANIGILIENGYLK